MKEADRLEEENVWRLSRGHSKDRGTARGHSVENRVPRGHSVDSTNINAHHGGRVGALSRKPGSVDSLLDWDSDSTRPPSIPPRSGNILRSCYDLNSEVLTKYNLKGHKELFIEKRSIR